MESLLFVFNGIAVVLLVFMGVRDDRRPPGAKQISVFRYFDSVTNPASRQAPGKPPPQGPAR